MSSPLPSRSYPLRSGEAQAIVDAFMDNELQTAEEWRETIDYEAAYRVPVPAGVTLSLVHSHTLSLSHLTLSLTLSLVHSISLTLPHSLALSLSRSHSLTLSPSHSTLSLYHSPTLSLSHSRAHSHSAIFTLTKT